MKTKRHNLPFAITLLLVSAFYILPLNLFHELACHDGNTVPCTVNLEGQIISEQHHHCPVLQLTDSPFESYKSNSFAPLCRTFYEHNSFVFQKFISIDICNRQGRSPPVV